MITSDNKAFGFHGATNGTPRAKDAAFAAAASAIVALTAVTFEQARMFLDSKYGRHLADRVSDLAQNGVSSPIDTALLELVHKAGRVINPATRAIVRTNALREQIYKAVLAGK